MEPNTPSLQERNNRRKQTYKQLLLCQIAMSVFSLVVYEVIKLRPFPGSKEILEVCMGMLSLATTFVGYKMLKSFIRDKKITSLILQLFIFSVVGSVLAANPFLPLNETFAFLLLTISQFIGLGSFSIILYFIILDLFKEDHDMIYRLWVAASIFLCIAEVFSIVFVIVEIFFPGSMGLGIHEKIDTSLYIDCSNYSLYIISGLDSPYEKVNGLIRNIAVIESVFSNLYVVLVIGRLLSK